MKPQIILLITLSIIIASCDKDEPGDEFVPIEYVGDIVD